MDETQARYEAIRRYLAGERPVEICRTLGYSKPWLYTWLKRYEPPNLGWAQSRSRAPHRRTAKTPPAVERLVCEIRQLLVQTRYAQRDALAIQWPLQQLGLLPPVCEILLQAASGRSHGFGDGHALVAFTTWITWHMQPTT
jgi:putative transposase